MIVVCAWCAREGKPSFQHEKEPYEDTQVSHGMCPIHEIEWRAQADQRRARRAARATVVGLLALLFATGCGPAVHRAPAELSLASTETRMPDGSTGYRVGDLTVVVADAETVDRECRFQGVALFHPSVQVRGCYLRATKRIYSLPDAFVLLHEFKHHFDGAFHE